MNHIRIDRRRFLAVAATLPLVSRVAFARAASVPDARFVFILLRGALDGLATVPPCGDPSYAGLRREIAIPRPGEPNGALALDTTFALHPGLPFLHECWRAKALLVAHAVATPYRERSHFDGQDVLENGGVRPNAFASGWLNRALTALPQGRPGSHGETGSALGQNLPLTMRGPAPVASWSPSRLPAIDDDTLTRIADLYARDPVLSVRLADALAADEVAQGASMETAPRGGGARYLETLRAAGSFLAREEGPQVAMLDTTGWDTHANEGGAQGQLATRLGALDAGLRALKEALGAAWSRSVVVLATEFGRTAAVNGTRGTDHGTATVAFVLGGAVEGGRMLTDWPGLSRGALYQQRDLAPTLDLRSVLKGVLHDHLRVSSAALDSDVFPDSSMVRPAKDL
ncbi:MAG: DUF1501 domain-containing protein, partial [Steroidobacteraceae bacterium]|nr:DUF1501 domain-containing protein [Steroidobacteraceae bacterium]